MSMSTRPPNPSSSQRLTPWRLQTFGRNEPSASIAKTSKDQIQQGVLHYYCSKVMQRLYNRCRIWTKAVNKSPTTPEILISTLLLEKNSNFAPRLDTKP